MKEKKSEIVKVKYKNTETDTLLAHPAIEEYLKLLMLEVKDYLGDRLLGDTARAPISQCSCEGTDWHSSLGRSAPYPHSAHLGNKESQSLFKNKELTACAAERDLLILHLFAIIREGLDGLDWHATKVFAISDLNPQQTFFEP